MISSNFPNAVFYPTTTSTVIHSGPSVTSQSREKFIRFFEKLSMIQRKIIFAFFSTSQLMKPRSTQNSHLKKNFLKYVGVGQSGTKQ